MKRRLVQIAIVIVIAIIGIIIFIKYFPSIWGEAIYPLEYKEEIQKSADEFKLEKNFIAAVIYSESRFHADSQSGAGAKGLMQLMPATARGVASAIGMSDYNDSKIFEPAVNIRLGSAYLKQQYDKYNGNYDAVLAHYNGGPGAAGILLDAGVNFLNHETFGFVNKVKNVWKMYDQIYGKNWEGGQSIIKSESFADTLTLKNLFQFILGK